MDDDFRKRHARLVRDLADKAADPFIKRRLQDLASRYEINKRTTPLTPLDLEIANPARRPDGASER
ncbi:hypothetical protein [Bradyrhizobium jicamae]|uniref:hypothetical protein n=1 Tax=Bradyrhizobium jicamae TaxID=280332 RepID=UPI001BAD3AD7|nr:hypothetical protein [Bradyrhizobium jicamae]MBR0939490.1 hypothetical protein [Bradyrhizobium jicamae]